MWTFNIDRGLCTCQRNLRGKVFYMTANEISSYEKSTKSTMDFTWLLSLQWNYNSADTIYWLVIVRSIKTFFYMMFISIRQIYIQWNPGMIFAYQIMYLNSISFSEISKGTINIRRSLCNFNPFIITLLGKMQNT